jgi:hypothetical protein
VAANDVSSYSRSVDVAVSLAFVLALALLYRVAVSVEGAGHLFWEAAFFFVLAAAFFSARYYSEQVSLLGVIRWICERSSFPRGLYMTVVYAMVFAGVALIQLARWLALYA